MGVSMTTIKQKEDYIKQHTLAPVFHQTLNDCCSLKGHIQPADLFKILFKRKKLNLLLTVTAVI